ncbi:MAG: acyltransferase [Candidatus Adiutrix sp.]|nr:acyltransferase [Candidatus Adiutrix sp.]
MSAPAIASTRREAGIELGRIFCCYCVIVIHIQSFYAAKPVTSLIWTWAKCAATPVFFLITGFFFDPAKPFRTYLERLLKRVVLPTVFLLLAVAQLTPWLSGQAPLTACFTGPNWDNFGRVGRIMVSFWPYEYLPDYNPFISLWFTFALILCYLCFPVLKLLCGPGEGPRAVKKYLLGLGLFLFVFRVSLLTFFPDNFTVQHLDWWIQEKPFYWLWLILLGHHLGLWLKDERAMARLRARLPLLGLAAYLSGGLALFWLTLNFNVDEAGLVNQRFFVREFVFYLAAQLGMFLFFAGLKLESARLSGLILFVADKTFYIYMTHEAVYHKILTAGGFDLDTAPGYLGFASLTFAVSLAVACLLKKAERLIRRALA